LRLLNGEALDLAQATASHIHRGAPIGFYLAEKLADAHVFGSYRRIYAVINVDMDGGTLRHTGDVHVHT
jgi:hypothetical protein